MVAREEMDDALRRMLKRREKRRMEKKRYWWEGFDRERVEWVLGGRDCELNGVWNQQLSTTVSGSSEAMAYASVAANPNLVCEKATSPSNQLSDHHLHSEAHETLWDPGIHIPSENEYNGKCTHEMMLQMCYISQHMNRIPLSCRSRESSHILLS